MENKENSLSSEDLRNLGRNYRTRVTPQRMQQQRERKEEEKEINYYADSKNIVPITYELALHLGEPLSREPMCRLDAVRNITRYIKQNNLLHGSMFNLDERLSKLLKTRGEIDFSYPTIRWYLNQHFHTDHTFQTPSALNGFERPSCISEKLSDFLDIPPDTQVSRVFATRIIVKHIKDKKLQESHHGGSACHILPDDALSDLFEWKRDEIDEKSGERIKLTFPLMQRLLQKHFIHDAPHPQPIEVDDEDEEDGEEEVNPIIPLRRSSIQKKEKKELTITFDGDIDIYRMFRRAIQDRNFDMLSKILENVTHDLDFKGKCNAPHFWDDVPKESENKKTEEECPISLSIIKKGDLYTICETCKKHFSFFALKRAFFVAGKSNCPMCRSKWKNFEFYVNE
jgi:chromatin remodeling complex protein RSC6